GIARDVARREGDERVDAHLLAADARADTERTVCPLPAFRQLSGNHRELCEAAVGAPELLRVAERLQDLDRPRSELAGAHAVAREPVQAREHARTASECLHPPEVAPDVALLLVGGE